MSQQPETSVAHSFFLCRPFVGYRCQPFKRATERAKGFSQKIGPAAVLVHSPGIVQGNGTVKKIARMNGRPRKIAANGCQQGFIPPAGNAVLLCGYGDCRQPECEQPTYFEYVLSVHNSTDWLLGRQACGRREVGVLYPDSGQRNTYDVIYCKNGIFVISF